MFVLFLKLLFVCSFGVSVRAGGGGDGESQADSSVSVALKPRGLDPRTLR